MHTGTHRHMCMYIQAHKGTHWHICACAHKHMYTHTHIHTHAHMCLCRSSGMETHGLHSVHFKKPYWFWMTISNNIQQNDVMSKADVINKRTELGTKAVKSPARRAGRSYWGILNSVLDAMIYKGHQEEFQHFLMMLEDTKINKTVTSRNVSVLISQDGQEIQLKNYYIRPKEYF